MDELLGLRPVGPLQFYFTRLGRRLRWRDGWLLAQRSLWLASLAAVSIQLAGRVWPVNRLWLWTLAPLAVWLLVVLGLSLARPLPARRVARRCDTELALKERLATALMLEGGAAGDWEPALVALQREDALAVARAVHPRRALPLRWRRRPLLLAAVLMAAAVALAVLPNALDDVLAERVAVAQAAEEQAEQIERLRQEIEQAQELTPEEREALLRQLAELVEQLRANPGDREEALADLSKTEETLRQKLDANADARQAALEAMATQLSALIGEEPSEEADLSEAAEALEKMADQLALMGASERETLAQSLTQMAARAAQAGDTDLAQALAVLAQAVQSGDSDAASQAAQAAAEAFSQAQGELADQTALRQALSQLQESRQAMAQAGQGQAVAQGQGQGQPGGGGGTKADTLPPASSSGKADRPQGEGGPGATGQLDDQVYVPWERRQGSGDEVTIAGQNSGQGETQVREQKEPLPGASGEALVPYYEVYYNYLDAANQTMERSYIPSGLKDYVRQYFSQLEP